jgi:hypothetical protein
MSAATLPCIISTVGVDNVPMTFGDYSPGYKIKSLSGRHMPRLKFGRISS